MQQIKMNYNSLNLLKGLISNNTVFFLFDILSLMLQHESITNEQKTRNCIKITQKMLQNKKNDKKLFKKKVLSRDMCYH